MIKRGRKIVGLAIMSACFIMTMTGCMQSSNKGAENTTSQEVATVDPNLTKATKMEYIIPEETGEIFTEERQTSTKEEIDKKLSTTLYTPEAPLVYYNPFGTNLRSANIYFTTEQASSVTYTISVEDQTIPAFTRQLENGEENGVTTNHAYQLVGFIPDMDNTVTLTFYNKDGAEIGKNSFVIAIPKVETAAEQKLTVEEVKDVEDNELTDGLFSVFYGRRNGQLVNIDLYDNDGILRGELYVDGYRTDRILFIDGYLYYSVDEDKIVKVNRLGQAEKIYQLGQYEMHHDMAYQEDRNSFVILANDTKQDTVEDMLIELNLETGEVSKLIDLKDILPEAYEKAVLPKGDKKLDWAHVNAIQFIEDDSVALSFRELSSIVKIGNIFDKPELEYILSDKNVWEGTSYESYVYDKVGDFTAQAGQHSITYVPGEKEGEYTMYLFNNNMTYSGTRRDIDWSGYTLAQVPEDERSSYYYEYKINENDKTFELVDSFEVPYSGYVSSVQQVGDNQVICSGAQKLFGEYDSEGNLLRQYKSAKEQYIYRTFKYTFDGIWFAGNNNN